MAPGGTGNGNDSVDFYGGSNITFTDNAESQVVGALLFDQTSNVTISNNSFSNNGSMQISNCHNCNVTGNYSVDSGIDLEDAFASPPGTTTGTWSNNTFACVNGVGSMTTNPGNAAFYGGTCPWTAGLGCSEPVLPCTPGEYSGVTYQNNTITGPGASLLWSSFDSATLINNSFTNGGVLTVR